MSLFEAGIEFETDVREIVDTFLTLPAPLRPTHFSHSEKVADVCDKVGDSDRLSAFLKRSQSGFFFVAAGLTYSVRIALGKPTQCDCFLDVSPALLETFLAHMATARPIFGFSCEPQEREQRNRVVIKQGESVIESWVGRDLSKYIPGLYWLTLLPQGLIDRHNIPLSTLQAIAKKHHVLKGGLHLFQFYDAPEDWSSNGLVSLPGIFNVEMARAELATAKNFVEFNLLLKRWK